MKLSDIVRERVKKCGISNYALAKAAGIELPSLCRFLGGKHSITLTTLEKIMPIVGLALVETDPMLPPYTPPGRPKH